jgi:hypothetical protein
MFDFTVTGKPVFFFTPDLEHCMPRKLRGLYFDLIPVVPGRPSPRPRNFRGAGAGSGCRAAAIRRQISRLARNGS